MYKYMKFLRMCLMCSIIFKANCFLKQMIQRRSTFLEYIRKLKGNYIQFESFLMIPLDRCCSYSIWR